MKISSKPPSGGRITLPAEIRTRLGLKPGDQVEFALEEERTVIRPFRKEPNLFLRYIGALRHFQSEHEVNNWVRDMREEDSDPQPNS